MSRISLSPKIEKKANRKNFPILYKHYLPFIKKYFEKRVNNELDAEDLTSTVFEKALNGIESFKWQGVSFSAWIFKIAKNTLIDFYRSNKTTVDLESIKDTLPQKGNLEQQIYSEINFEQILDSLDGRERKIIYMKFFEGHTNKSISEKLGLSESNIGTIVYRVLKKLKSDIP